jgi:putative transposase
VKAYKYKIKPNKKFVENATRTLDICRELYNAALQERRDAWKIARVSVTYSLQQNQLPSIKKDDRPDLKDVHSQVLQDVLARVDKAFQGFFGRIKNGSEPGYPRFKGTDRYDSITYPQSGFELEGDKLHLSKIGSCRIRLSRPIEGIVKTCTIKREADGWYVSFAVETDQAPKIPRTGQRVGVDMGTKTFAAFSDESRIENPRFQKKLLDQLAEAQQQFDQYKTNFKSKKRAKLKVRITRLHRKIRNQRLDWAHKQVNKVIERYDEIHIEDLDIKQMVDSSSGDKSKLPPYIDKTGMRRNIHDAGWNLFLSLLIYKAAEAGRRVFKKNPRNTSQTCSHCYYQLQGDERLTLEDRFFDCPQCGLHIDRDLNAAINILQSKDIVEIKVHMKNRFRAKQKNDEGRSVPSSSKRISTYSSALAA